MRFSRLFCQFKHWTIILKYKKCYEVKYDIPFIDFNQKLVSQRAFNNMLNKEITFIIQILRVCAIRVDSMKDSEFKAQLD